MLDSGRARPIDHPAVQRVLDAAERKGVDLDVVTFDESTHTAEEAALAVGGELGQIVKSLVFVAPPTTAGADRLASSPGRTGSTSPAWRRSPASRTSGGRRRARRTS